MNVLLFHPDKQSLDRIVFCLESQINLTVCTALNFQEAIEFLLGENSVDLILTSIQPETDKLFKYLLSTGASIPVILVSNDKQKNLEAYPDISLIGRISQENITEELLPLIQKNFNDHLALSSNNDYCRISTELLVQVVPLRGDVYIRLSNVKFVKLFKTGSVFTQEDLKKFLIKRKVNYLYIKKNETQEFVRKFQTDLSQWVEEAVVGDSSLLDTVTEVHSLIQELADRLGFTPEVQALARDNIQLTLKAIGANPKLTKALANSQLKGKNYISSHSILLANISCSIAAQMQWPSSTTFHKLVLASLFHDFSFQHPELAKISSKAEMESLKKDIPQEQYDTLKNHPFLAADAIKNMQGVPGDVEFLILQHHERPDGTGFPKGLHGPKIAPLAAVFIIAHDIINHMTKVGSDFSLPNFLKSMENEYQTGPFRKVWRVLSHEPDDISGEEEPAA